MTIQEVLTKMLEDRSFKACHTDDPDNYIYYNQEENAVTWQDGTRVVLTGNILDENWIEHEGFADGEVLHLRERSTDWIFIYRRGVHKTSCYGFTANGGYAACHEGFVCPDKNILELRRATQEEKQRLFDDLIKVGYYWCPDMKTSFSLCFKVGDSIYNKETGENLVISYIKDGQYHATNGTVFPVKLQDDWIKFKFEIGSQLDVFWFVAPAEISERQELLRKLQSLSGQTGDQSIIIPQGNIVFNERDCITTAQPSNKIARAAMMMGREIKIKEE